MDEAAKAILTVSTALRGNSIAVSGRVKTRQQAENFIGELTKLSAFLHEVSSDDIIEGDVGL